MIEVARRKSQAGLQVVRLEIRHFVKDLGRGKAGREEIENITHANAHPAHAGPAPTLLRVHGDSISNLVHSEIIAAASSALHDLKTGQGHDGVANAGFIALGTKIRRSGPTGPAGPMLKHAWTAAGERSLSNVASLSNDVLAAVLLLQG
jgi:hypothetical protein